MANRKWVKNVLKEMGTQGWRTRQGRGGHTVCYCPCGEHIVTMPDSPHGGSRTHKNLIKEIERTCFDSSVPS